MMSQHPEDMHQHHQHQHDYIEQLDIDQKQELIEEEQQYKLSNIIVTLQRKEDLVKSLGTSRADHLSATKQKNQTN